MGRGTDETVFNAVAFESKNQQKAERGKEKEALPWGDLSFDKSLLDKIKKTKEASRKTTSAPPEKAVSRVWPDIGPVRNPKNIIGNHKTSAVWLGEIEGRKVIVKLPGARITKKGELYLPGSATLGVMASHETTASRSLRAEVLVDELLHIAGDDWKTLFAPVEILQIEEGGLEGQEVLLVDYIDGQELAASYEKDLPSPEKTHLGLSEEEKAYRKKAWENLWSADPERRQQVAEDGRRILFVDLISMNGDRHLGNMLLQNGRLRAYDQGMAFAREYDRRSCQFETQIIRASGGMDLRDNEREFLEKILRSDWLERVESKLGRKSREAVESRIRWMLKEGKLYSEKTKMVS
jgi:hypothetical protein